MDENKVGSLIADSRLAFIQGKYKESLILAKKALDEEPKNADAHQCAGNAHMSFGDYTSAIDSYKTAVECDPDNGDRYFNLGYAYASNDQSAEALAMFAKADEIGCSPNVIGQLYKIMAMLCFDMKNFEDAVLNFIKAEKIIGIDMDVLQRKALSYSMTGDTSSAIEVANQMKLLAPTDYAGYRIAFNILLQEERLEEAEKELDRAERFAKPKPEIFFDWVAYEMARYKLDGEKAHLDTALQKISDGLCILEPEVGEVIDSYVNAAEIYIQLENADMALNCLHAAENPIHSYNHGFSVIELPLMEIRPVSRPSEREINHAIEAVRRKYGDRRLEAMGRELMRKNRRSNPDAEEYMTPLAEIQPGTEEIYTLGSDVKASYTMEKLDQIYRLYVAAYTLKKDTANIRTYASKLANSQDTQSKYIGKYSLVKALRDEGYEKIDEEYQALQKFLRNAMIKDPADLLALNFRVQCCIDLGEFDEAEKLCSLLSDELKAPLKEQIDKARSGGEV